MATFPANLHPKFDPFTYLSPEGETPYGKIKGWEQRSRINQNCAGAPRSKLAGYSTEIKGQTFTE
ncbi:hypothetical protein EO93_00170 [Methanosarcina sp. 1.H.A.2.2]|nr:hypothetical protein EO93_00170 [Methanosarcina sp. 1.H.A.2.2]